MLHDAPKPVDLTESEAELYSRIDAAPDDQPWDQRADAMELLVSSLFDRNAIPEGRLLLFSEPGYAETRNKSPQQVFEANGTCGSAIFRHPHFVPYLRHFIFGPDLRKLAIQRLCKILNDDMGTSGEIMDQYRACARTCVRDFGLTPHKAGTEFFRLGVEIGMELFDARTLREAARSAR